ncbi:MAG: phosphotransferase family protein [Eubacteriales bacterium]
MNLYEDFINNRHEIGSGMTAKVYAYHGYAYKCYADDYPKERIDYEYELQHEIMKSELPVPCYYESEFPKSIKMDFINGISMYERLFDVGKDIVVTEMMACFERIHQVKGLKLQSTLKYIQNTIEQAPVGKEETELAVQCISKVENAVNEPDVLCHMDYHFLNLLYEEDEIFIIDWVNAKNGKAIWDFARSYVIFYEYAAEMAPMYFNEVKKRKGYQKELFMMAVYVSAIIRLTEHDNQRIRQLIGKTLIM